MNVAFVWAFGILGCLLLIGGLFCVAVRERIAVNLSKAGIASGGENAARQFALGIILMQFVFGLTLIGASIALGIGNVTASDASGKLAGGWAVATLIGAVAAGTLSMGAGVGVLTSSGSTVGPASGSLQNRRSAKQRSAGLALIVLGLGALAYLTVVLFSQR